MHGYKWPINSARIVHALARARAHTTSPNLVAVPILTALEKEPILVTRPRVCEQPIQIVDTALFSTPLFTITISGAIIKIMQDTTVRGLWRPIETSFMNPHYLGVWPAACTVIRGTATHTTSARIGRSFAICCCYGLFPYNP